MTTTTPFGLEVSEDEIRQASREVYSEEVEQLMIPEFESHKPDTEALYEAQKDLVEFTAEEAEAAEKLRKRMEMQKSDTDNTDRVRLSYPEDLPPGVSGEGTVEDLPGWQTQQSASQQDVEQDDSQVNSKEGKPLFTLEQASAILEQVNRDKEQRIQAAKLELARICEKYQVDLVVQSQITIQLKS